MNFREFLQESNILNSWHDNRDGTYTFMVRGVKPKNNVIRELINIQKDYKMPNGSGYGSAGSAGTYHINKRVTAKYGFSEALMGSYLKINNVDVNNALDFFKLMSNIAIRVEDMFVMPFGKTGVLMLSEDEFNYLERDDDLESIIYEHLIMFEDSPSWNERVAKESKNIVQKVKSMRV